MSASFAWVLPAVVHEHLEEVVFARELRSWLLVAPHVRLRQIARLDERVAAHLDGLAVAGDEAWPLFSDSMATLGGSFALAVRAIEARQAARLASLFALAESQPPVRRGLISALGWSSPRLLQGLVKQLLASKSGLHRQVGMAACAVHRVDPGTVLAQLIADPDRSPRTRALRAAGELGRTDLLPQVRAALQDDRDEVRFWAAWSAVLLGDQENAAAIDTLSAASVAPGRLAESGFALLAMSIPVSRAPEILGPRASDPAQQRSVVRGAGLIGDVTYVPWLIRQAALPQFARLAAEAFSLITGVDLGASPFSRARPEDLETGPNDDPDDPNVDMDEDEGLPWLDPVKIEAWWNAHSHRFQPGVRYFMGEPRRRENCLRVLKEGYQRQRIAAAIHLSLLEPGTPLFEWRAPAWRQQRLLAAMT
jgi:uncharacterized protein (TIGR02270 family)